MSLSPSGSYGSFATHPDVDYYLRKIHRLEGDQQMLQDQLNNTRVRLLRAEQFQLKYEVATKKISKLCIENDSLLKEIRELKVLIDTMRIEMELLSANSPRKERDARKGERSIKRSYGGPETEENREGGEGERMEQGEDRTERREDEEHGGSRQSGENVDVERYLSQIESWKQRCKKLEKQSEERVNFLKQQFQTQNIRTHERLSRQQQNKVQQLKQQLSKYKKLYQQKSHLDDFVREKTQRVKVEKEKEISRLKKIIESKEQDLEIKNQESVSELRAVADKYSTILNMELEKIHTAMDNQDQLFETETKGLRKLLEIKDAQIEGMLETLKKNTDKHMNEREDLKNQIEKLREVLYDVQRENETELYNLKERLTSLNADEIEKISAQYENNKNSLSEQIVYNKKLLSKKDEQFKSQIKEMERVCRQLQAKIDEKDHKISELLERLSSTGNQNSHEVKEITHSLQNIQLENEKISAGLNDNIAFKNNQINKLTSSIQLKNIEIKNLYQNISLLKKQMGEVQRELEAKWKQQRKDRQTERDELRQQLENVESEWKAKERDWKLKEKSLSNDKQRLQRENLKLKLSRDDLQKVNADLSHQVKQIDSLYKTEIKKSHQATFDTGSLRRELMHEIEKQQIDLQLAKKQEVEDLKKKHEIELDRYRFQLSNVQNQLNTRTNEVEKLNEELKKLDSNAEKVLRGKFQEYQQKLAALNSEIYMTQNLYNTFMQGKARVKRGGGEKQ